MVIFKHRLDSALLGFILSQTNQNITRFSSRRVWIWNMDRRSWPLACCEPGCVTVFCVMLVTRIALSFTLPHRFIRKSTEETYVYVISSRQAFRKRNSPSSSPVSIMGARVPRSPQLLGQKQFPARFCNTCGSPNQL